jgi:hypothetical protein
LSTGIKSKFEIVTGSYDIKEEIKDNVCNKMIGKTAYLKDNEGINFQTAGGKDQKSLPLFTSLFSKKYEDNRQAYNSKGLVVLELSRIWPFRLPADNQ